MGDLVKDELDFYTKFTKPLIFNLPDPKDRVLAAAWVRKIRDQDAGIEKLRLDYIKLLLFALQRRKLVGIFADDPTNYDQLEEMPPDLDLNDIARRLIEKEQADRVDKITKQIRGQIGDYPPYTTDCSSDFREYVAAQDIPGFGVHCYYAISKEPVNKWQKADKGIFPKMAKSAVDTTSPTPPGVAITTSEPTCTCPPPEGEKESECKKRAEAKQPEPKKKYKKRLGKTPPVAPLGSVPLPEERTPPTWGSNLVEVKDMPQGNQIRDDEDDDEDEEPGLESLGPLEGLSEVSFFMDEFKKEAISKISPKKPGKSTKGGPFKSARLRQKKETTISGATAKKSMLEDMEAEDFVDEDMDLEQSRREEGIREDSQLMDYLQDQLNKSATQRKIAKTHAVREIPAQAGIPVTTPRASPSPTRPRSTEKLVRDPTVEPPPIAPKSDASGEIDVDALDDEELADMGLTREEAKQLFATDVFKVPTEDEFADVFQTSMKSGGSVEMDVEKDAEWLEWEKRMKALEDEAQQQLQELVDDAGLDASIELDMSVKGDLGSPQVQKVEEDAAASYFRDSEDEMVEYNGYLISKANYDFLMSAEDAPKSPPQAAAPVVAQAPCQAKVSKLKKPGKLGKPGQAKAGQAKSAQAKPDQTKPGQRKPAAKPSQSKIGQPKPSKTKIPPPGARAGPSGVRKAPGSKAPPPGASKVQPSKPPSKEVVASPKTPVQKGSPQAAPVLTEFEKMMKIRERVADVMQEVEPDYPPGVDRTPPIFSQHEKVRQAAQGLVYAPEEFGIQEGQIDWQHAPDFFAGQTEFRPFDPRQKAQVEDLFPGLERQAGAELFFDMEGEPNIFDEGEYIDEMVLPPSPLSDSAKKFKELELYSRLEESLMEGPCLPCGGDISPPQLESPDRRFLQQSFEHELPQSIALTDLPPLPSASPTRTPPKRPSPSRQLTPPSGLREHFTPPPLSSSMPCTPGSAARKYFTPPLPSSPPRTPSPQRITPQQPQIPCPAGRAPSPENIYTCEALSPDLENILKTVTPDRILTAQGMIASSPLFDVSPQLERTPPANVFGIEGLENLDISASFLDEVGDLYGAEDSPCGPCARPASARISPSELMKQSVGYSVAQVTPKQVAPLSPKYLEYKSPKKKLTKVERRKLQQQESQYIDFLYGEDKDTYETVKRALEMVADVEQEEPDPYHLMPQISSSPPSPYEGMFEESGLLSESFPSYEQVTPPSSPLQEVATGPSAAAVSAQLCKSAGAIQRTGIPESGGISPKSRKTGIPAPGRSGIAAPCRSGIPGPGGSGRPGPGRSGIPAPGRSGKPAPGRSGIPAPGRSGIPAPGRSRIPGPGTCQSAAGSGIARPTQIRSRQLPTAEDLRVAEFVHKAPDRGPAGMSYLPEQPSAYGPYPPMKSGFREAIQQHQIDQVFFEPHRPLMQSRSVVTGKTATKRKQIDRISSSQMPPCRPPVELTSDLYRQHYDIAEVPEEPPGSPRTYGVPGIQVPSRPQIPQPPTTWAPIPLSPDLTGKQAAKSKRGISPGSKLRSPGSKSPTGSPLRRPCEATAKQMSPQAPPPPPGVIEAPCPCAGSTSGVQQPSQIKQPSPSTKGTQIPKSPTKSKSPDSAKQKGVCPCAAEVAEELQYDWEELKKWGLTEEDLRPINTDLNLSNVSDLPAEEVGEAEYVPDAIDQSFEKWEAQMKQLEEEYAEDIAQYGASLNTSGTEPQPTCACSPEAPAPMASRSPVVPTIPIDRLGEAIALKETYGDLNPENLELLLKADYAGGPLMPVHKIPNAIALIQKHGEMDPEDLLYLLDEEELVGIQTSKGFKPHTSKKVQYPAQIPVGTPPLPPRDWWEDETPSPACQPFIPPPRPPSPMVDDQRFAGFLRSPRPGPSRIAKTTGMIYSPPQYDSPGGGALEESPPRFAFQDDYMDLQIGPAAPSPPSPPRQIVAQPPPCQPCLPKARRQKSQRQTLSRQKLDFDYVGPTETNIADEYIESVLERYDEILPPLPPEQMSPTYTPTRPPPTLAGWKTPEKIEQMVPKRKTPTPKVEYRIPEMKPHEWFQQAPPATVDMEQSILMESPIRQPVSPPQLTPGRMPLRADVFGSGRVVSPLPEIFGQTPPLGDLSFDMCMPCSPMGISPGGAGIAEEIFAGAGVSPARLPPPSPPSPYSTDQAMQQMMANVREAQGREGIVRMPTWFNRKQEFKPMRPITEVSTQPTIGRMGLPEVVQLDLETLGTGQCEEPCVRSPYIPPKRPSPMKEVYSDEEEEFVDDIYGDMATFIPPEELQGVAPISPLSQFQQAQVTPPRLSPKLPRVSPGTPMLEQTALSFEEVDMFERTPLGTPQVTPKPSPYLSPGVSPRWTPSSRPVFSPQLPTQGPNELLLSDYCQPCYESPEYAASRPITPQYMSPESSYEQDEMGLPSLVQLYTQNMPPIYSSPTERRERRILSRDGAPTICSGGNIQVDALPVPEEQVYIDLPIAPLPPYVERIATPPLNLSPTLPQYQGMILDENIDMDALYAAQCRSFEMSEAASVPSAGTPSPRRQLSPRTPSPRRLGTPRTPPHTVQKWDQLLNETQQADKFEASFDFAPSPCGSCSPSTRSPMTVRSPSPQVARRQSPLGVRSPSPQRAGRLSPRSPPPVSQGARSPVQAARSPAKISSPKQTPPRSPPIKMPELSPFRLPQPSPPIQMPELSPFRLPQPSPPCVPCRVGGTEEVSAPASPKSVVQHKMTQRKIVTVLPPPPTVPLEFEGEIVEPLGRADRSDSDMEDDSDFRWMD